jgi:polysaccharide chain length determinant protein (PEP-CTERM system associated)
MNEKAETIKLDYYINLIFKRRWLIIIPFCLSMIIGIYLAITLPKIYKASSLISISPQRVPDDYVRSIVEADISSRINSISQEIMSRTNLKKIIEKFNIFSDSKHEQLFMEDKIDIMRGRIEVELNRAGRNFLNAFTISYNGPDPMTVMKVTSALANNFIIENIRTREAHAVGTSDFLDEQLQVMKERLQDVEKHLRDYRKRHMGELPEQLESNLRILDTLQKQLSESEDRLRDEKNRLVIIENEIKARKESLAAGSPLQSEDGEAVSLLQLKNQLANLQSSYTERHPDVIRLKAKIDDLEAKLKKGEIDTPGGTNSSSAPNEDQLLTSTVLGNQIRLKTVIKMEIQNIQGDIHRLKNQLKIYRQRIERTPKREEELISLKRDYQNIQATYSSLLNRQLEAKIAVNMEKEQKGEKFRIIDSAVLPHKPDSPDMIKLFMIVVAAGLGVGCGLIYLLDYLDTSLKRPEGFESDLGVAVLATIPKVYQKKDFRLKRLNQVMTGLSLLVAAGLLAGFAVLVFHGVEPTIEIVRPYIASLKI